MKKITELIKSGKVLVSDGAWGTFLYEKGLEVGDCPELWNITHSDDVFNIAKSYIDAGADMIETNSFGGTCLKLEHYDLQDRMAEINKEAAMISRRAAGSNKIVLGSMGPTGKILMMGDVTEEEMYDSFKNQAIALESGGADAAIIETMMALDEALIAIKAVKENTKLEIICTFTFDKTLQNEYRTMMGFSPQDIVDEVILAGADIIGANCSNGLSQMIEIVKQIRLVNTQIPIIIQANAGLPVMHDDKVCYLETPEIMASYVEQLIEAGADIIGGCCGSTPAHIKKIVEMVEINQKEK